MTELIDPKALKQYIDDCKVCDNCPDKNMRCYDGCELPDFLTKQWERIIDEQPIIEAEPVRHGRYIGTEFDGYADGNPVYYEWKCSECGCVFEEEEPTYNYCPNCGARMDDDRDELTKRL